MTVRRMRLRVSAVAAGWFHARSRSEPSDSSCARSSSPNGGSRCVSTCCNLVSSADDQQTFVPQMLKLGRDNSILWVHSMILSFGSATLVACLIEGLIREQDINVLPSVSSLRALRAFGKPSRATQPMVGFGNPLLEGSSPAHALTGRGQSSHSLE
jgi:hypothetical protein